MKVAAGMMVEPKDFRAKEGERDVKKIVLTAVVLGAFVIEIGEGCQASPAFHQGRIYLRTKRHLVCLGDAAHP